LRRGGEGESSADRRRVAVRLTAPFKKFVSVHANVHNLFDLERHPIDRQTDKTRRSAALAEWKSLMA